MNPRIQIQPSLDYIDQNLCEDVKLDEIAKQSNFSEFHFHRLFQKTVGKPVMKYVREKRLHKASEELAGTDGSITDIAFRYQFGSEESFSRAFKRQYGVSPREFRRSSREFICCRAA